MTGSKRTHLKQLQRNITVHRGERKLVELRKVRDCEDNSVQPTFDAVHIYNEAEPTQIPSRMVLSMYPTSILIWKSRISTPASMRASNAALRQQDNSPPSDWRMVQWIEITERG